MTSPRDPAPRRPDGALADRPVARPSVVADMASSAPADSPRRGGQRERSRDGVSPVDARLRWLAAVSHALASSSDVVGALGVVARLAVPALGDWCLIDLGGAGTLARRVACARTDPAQTEAARMLAQIGPDDVGIPCGIPSALRTGTLELVTEFGESELKGIRDPERRDVVRRLGIREVISAPLAVRGHVLGAVTLLAADSGRAFGEDDVALAEEMALRMALAVDNASLHEQMRRARAAKAEFLAVMSHELRTPLQAILGFSDLLRAGIPEAVSPAVRERVERIHSASQHLLSLVEQLLTASRIAAGREVVHAEPVDLTVFAREMVLLVEPLALAKGLRFVVCAPEAGMTIVTDVGKLRQILYNLLANAVKFTARGEVVLAVRREADRAVLEVRDTGIGIAPENLARIFDAFWQADESASGQRRGAGLGLSISQRLARLLGGDILPTSATGEGTTLVVVLPLAYEPPPAADPAT